MNTRFTAPPGLRQDLLERLDQNVGVDTGLDVRVGVGPGLGSFEGVEFGDDQAAGETCGARVIAVHCRVRTGQDHAAFGLELLQALKVRRAGGQARFQELATSVAIIA